MSTGAVSTSSLYQELQQYFQTRSSDQQALGKALQSGDLAGAQQEYTAIQTLAQSGPFANGDAYKITQREQDFTAVGQALQAGDLAGAQQAFAQLQSTFQKSGSNVQQQADQNPAVVVNLGSGTTGAAAGGSTSTTGSAATGTTAGSEIVLNLGTLTPGEQITIGVSETANGGEQLTVGIANPASTTATAASATGTTPATGSAAATTGSEIVLNLGTVTAGEQITIGVGNGANGGEQVSVSANQSGQTPQQITLNLNQSVNQQIILNLFNSATSATATSTGVSLSA